MDIERSKYLRELRRGLINHFNQDELQTLAFDLGIQWDELAGGTLSVKAQALIHYLARRGRLALLLKLLAEERPDATWPAIPPPEQQIEDEKAIVTNDSAGETALREYIDKISDWSFQSQLRESGPGTGIRDNARAITLATLGTLNGKDKGRLLRFLYDAGLLKPPAIVSLAGADLAGARLSGMNLQSIDLTGANLSRADLSRTRLGVTDRESLSKIMANSQKRTQKMLERIFREKSAAGEEEEQEAETGIVSAPSILRGAILSQANLMGAILSRTNLQQADLSGANLILANLERANLERTNLSHARLNNANLSSANLSGADLKDASLEGTRMDKVRLSLARNWSREQFTNVIITGEAITLPNGETLS